jgi:hypothetical protein
LKERKKQQFEGKKRTTAKRKESKTMPTVKKTGWTGTSGQKLWTKTRQFGILIIFACSASHRVPSSDKPSGGRGLHHWGV